MRLKPISHVEPLYLVSSDLNYSRTGTFLGKNKSKDVMNLPNSFRDLLKVILSWEVLHEIKGRKLVICSPARSLVILCWLAGNRNILLDAGWPLSDSVNSKTIKQRLKAKKDFCLDFLSFQLSKGVIFESDTQLMRSTKRFLLKKNKCYRIYTGFDETKSHSHLNLDCQSPKRLKVFFRGKMNAEAGEEKLCHISFHINNLAQMVVYTNKIESPDNFHPATETRVGNLPFAEIESAYIESAVVLGQLGNSPRLEWTIPHKIFEAAYYGKPIIAVRNKGLCELFSDEEILYIDNNSESAILSALDLLLKNDQLRRKYSTNIKLKYDSQIKQTILENQFLDLVNKIFS
jgi:hypothetical protein